MECDELVVGDIISELLISASNLADNGVASPESHHNGEPIGSEGSDIEVLEEESREGKMPVMIDQILSYLPAAVVEKIQRLYAKNLSESQENNLVTIEGGDDDDDVVPICETDPQSANPEKAMLQCIHDPEFQWAITNAVFMYYNQSQLPSDGTTCQQQMPLGLKKPELQTAATTGKRKKKRKDKKRDHIKGKTPEPEGIQSIEPVASTNIIDDEDDIILVDNDSVNGDAPLAGEQHGSKDISVSSDDEYVPEMVGAVTDNVTVATLAYRPSTSSQNEEEVVAEDIEEQAPIELHQDGDRSETLNDSGNNPDVDNQPITDTVLQDNIGDRSVFEEMTEDEILGIISPAEPLTSKKPELSTSQTVAGQNTGEQQHDTSTCVVEAHSSSVDITVDETGPDDIEAIEIIMDSHDGPMLSNRCSPSEVVLEIADDATVISENSCSNDQTATMSNNDETSTDAPVIELVATDNTSGAETTEKPTCRDEPMEVPNTESVGTLENQPTTDIVADDGSKTTAAESRDTPEEMSSGRKRSFTATMNSTTTSSDDDELEIVDVGAGHTTEQPTVPKPPQRMPRVVELREDQIEELPDELRLTEPKRKKRKKKANGVPDRWELFECTGDRVFGTRFVPCKLPLNRELCKKLKKRDDWFTPDDLFRALLLRGHQLGMLIDLTNTHSHYNPDEVTFAGVEYAKIMCPGRIVPPEPYYKQFEKYINEYEAAYQNKDLLIGVHCVHGVNQTAYMICRYMIDRLGFRADGAIQAFYAARGHVIEHQDYIDALYAADKNRRIPYFMVELQSSGSERVITIDPEVTTVADESDDDEDNAVQFRTGFLQSLAETAFRRRAQDPNAPPPEPATQNFRVGDDGVIEVLEDDEIKAEETEAAATVAPTKSPIAAAPSEPTGNEQCGRGSERRKERRAARRNRSGSGNSASESDSHSSSGASSGDTSRSRSRSQSSAASISSSMSSSSASEAGSAGPSPETKSKRKKRTKKHIRQSKTTGSSSAPDTSAAMANFVASCLSQMMKTQQSIMAFHQHQQQQILMKHQQPGHHVQPPQNRLVNAAQLPRQTVAHNPQQQQQQQPSMMQQPSGQQQHFQPQQHQGSMSQPGAHRSIVQLPTASFAAPVPAGLQPPTTAAMQNAPSPNPTGVNTMVPSGNVPTTNIQTPVGNEVRNPRQKPTEDELEESNIEAWRNYHRKAMLNAAKESSESSEQPPTSSISLYTKPASFSHDISLVPSSKSPPQSTEAPFPVEKPPKKPAAAKFVPPPLPVIPPVAAKNNPFNKWVNNGIGATLQNLIQAPQPVPHPSQTQNPVMTQAATAGASGIQVEPASGLEALHMLGLLSGDKKGGISLGGKPLIKHEVRANQQVGGVSQPPQESSVAVGARPLTAAQLAARYPPKEDDKEAPVTTPGTGRVAAYRRGLMAAGDSPGFPYNHQAAAPGGLATRQPPIGRKPPVIAGMVVTLDQVAAVPEHNSPAGAAEGCEEERLPVYGPVLANPIPKVSRFRTAGVGVFPQAPVSSGGPRDAPTTGSGQPSINPEMNAEEEEEMRLYSSLDERLHSLMN